VRSNLKHIVGFFPFHIFLIYFFQFNENKKIKLKVIVIDYEKLGSLLKITWRDINSNRSKKKSKSGRNKHFRLVKNKTKDY